MQIAITLAVGAVLGLNGVAMLLMPATWYELVPGAAETGPYNVHFVRDVGVAYLVAAVGAVWFAFDRRACAAALAGGAFLASHALIHIGEALDSHHAEHLMRDLPGVLLPPALVLWLAWPRRRTDNQRRNRHEKLVDATFDRRL